MAVAPYIPALMARLPLLLTRTPNPTMQPLRCLAIPLGLLAACQLLLNWACVIGACIYLTSMTESTRCDPVAPLSH